MPPKTCEIVCPKHVIFVHRGRTPRISASCNMCHKEIRNAVQNSSANKLLQPRHGQHSNVIPPKSPHTSQVAKKKQENFCARLPSHLLVFWAGSLPTFWQSPARPAATQPVQRELAHKSLAKIMRCKSQTTPYRWGKLRSHGHKHRHMAFQKKSCT